MKKLQNNFTTPEQSRRLLELGVPADSADMHISYSSRGSYSSPKFNDIRVSAYRSYFSTLDILPCWSAGRLIEILETCWTDRIESPIWYNHHGKGRTIIERVLWDFENRRLDFSKLED